ncbi:MAG: 50S ribosomal protein L17 [Spirochaetota bacterium]
MNKRNKVKKLNRNKAHRKAMINNMILSLLKYERIETTLARAKVVRSFAEKLITRAKKNLSPDTKPEQALHNKREVMKTLKDRDLIVKLFEDIAVRYKERNGGYTRILKLINRASDNSEVALLELVDRKTLQELRAEAAERNEKRAEVAKTK